MIFKEGMEKPVTPDTASQENPVVDKKEAVDSLTLLDSNDEVLNQPPQEQSTSDSNRPSKNERPVKTANGLRCRLVNDTYIIEPLKKPKSLKLRAMVALVLVAFMLTGSVFYYGSAIVGAQTTEAVAGNYGGIKKTGVSAAPISEETTVTGTLHVSLKASSVERDLHVRIIGDDGYPVAGHRFSIEITDPEGETKTYVNDSRDGRIYLDSLESGDYKVAMVPTDGFETPEPVDVEVLDKVQYKEIEDISDKINTSKDVNVAADDPQYGNAGTGNPDAGTPAPPPPAPQDTVEFVESKVVEKEGKVRYTGKIGENGRLYAKDGTLTNIIPVVVDGYMTGDYTLYEEPTPDPETTNPETTNPETTNPETTNPENGTGGDIDLFGKDQAGNYIYDVTKHAEITKTYYGWQDLDGKRYYFDKQGKKVTGNQVIQGKSFSFNSEGVLLTTAKNKLLGIDISTWQNSIDWNKVKAAGVDFVMIRAGFRGYGTGKLVEDDLFASNLRGAKAAGLRVGVYFFSQAINEVEGVEEASMVISLLKKYGSIDYPIAIDSEWSGAPGGTGRADNLSRATRTAVCVAFCETVRNAGYTPMIYASKSWFETNLSVGSFVGYKIWLAHYTPGGATSSYTGRYEMWQYTSKGTVNGIGGYVDMNYGYLGY